MLIPLLFPDLLTFGVNLNVSFHVSLPGFARTLCSFHHQCFTKWYKPKPNSADYELYTSRRLLQSELGTRCIRRTQKRREQTSPTFNVQYCSSIELFLFYLPSTRLC